MSTSFIHSFTLLLLLQEGLWAVYHFFTLLDAFGCVPWLRTPSTMERQDAARAGKICVQADALDTGRLAGGNGPPCIRNRVGQARCHDPQPRHAAAMACCEHLAQGAKASCGSLLSWLSQRCFHPACVRRKLPKKETWNIETRCFSQRVQRR